ncbi:hypothetical protein Tco_0434737 [Tanacetum coccineum]
MRQSTLIAIAIKFSMDLNATMPHRQDQLAKVSSSAFICAVMGRSSTVQSSGAFVFNMLILVEAILRTYLMPWCLIFCKGESDYKWSTTTVLISQTIAVGIGTISPTVRSSMAINFSCPKKAKKACGRHIGVEKYWIKKLLLWKMKLLNLNILVVGYGESRSLALEAKYQIFRLIDIAQQGIVLAHQSIRFASIVLCEKQSDKHLIELLEKVDSLLAFTGVKDIDSDKVPSLEEIVGSEVDLNEMALQRKGIKETIKALSDISKEKFTESAETHFIHMNEWFLEEDPSRLCIRMLAANSITEYLVSELPHVISNNAVKWFEEREQNYPDAVLLW